MEIIPEYIKRAEVLDRYGATPESGLGRWRTNQLRAEGMIFPVSRTWCRTGPEHPFEMLPTSREIEIARVVRAVVDRYCVWSLTALNPLLVHQRLRRLTIVEVERDDQRMVFERLRSEKFRNVILETDTKWVMDHVGGSDFDVIVRQLVTKAPIKDKLRGTPTLEKIIVDLFVDGQVLAGIAPSDLVHLIELAFSVYTIDIRVLRGYARRRNVLDKLMSYLEWLHVAPAEVLRDP